MDLLTNSQIADEGVRASDSRGERSGPPMTKVLRLRNGARSFFLGIGSQTEDPGSVLLVNARR